MNNKSLVSYPEPAIRPKDRQDAIRNQEDLIITKRKEIDRLWDDEVDVRYSLSIIFNYLLIIIHRTRIKALHPQTVRTSSNMFLRQTRLPGPLRDRTTRTIVMLPVLPQPVLSACATADWVEIFLIVAMPNLGVLHLGYRGRPCLHLKVTMPWILMRVLKNLK